MTNFAIGTFLAIYEVPASNYIGSPLIFISIIRCDASLYILNPESLGLSNKLIGYY